jgi:flagellar hook assembly protein FlgD
VEINVYNILGQKIKTLMNEFQPKGKHSVTWEGKDLKGRTVASGIYFYKIVAGDYTCVRKMIMLK